MFNTLSINSAKIKTGKTNLKMEKIEERFL